MFHNKTIEINHRRLVRDYVPVKGTRPIENGRKLEKTELPRGPLQMNGRAKETLKLSSKPSKASNSANQFIKQIAKDITELNTDF